MRARGRRTALAAAVLGLGTLLVAGILLRDEILWRWRMRGVVQVRIEAERITSSANFSLTDPVAIVHASQVTRNWVRSLTDAGDQYDSLMIFSDFSADSQVLFLTTLDPKPWVYSALSLQYFDIGEDKYILSCNGRTFECTREGWQEFLREVIRPTVPDLILKMNDPQADRVEAARTLAWVEPMTEGLLEFLLEVEDFQGLSMMGPYAIPGIPKLLGLLYRTSTTSSDKMQIVGCFGLMGSGATKAVPALIHLLENPEEIEDSTNLVINALGRIGPGATSAIPALEKLIATGQANLENQEAAAAALKKIRGDRNP